MDTSGVIQLVSIVILIFLSGFFSSAETALSTVNRVRMRTLEEEGNKRAARVNKVLDNYSKMISTILIGNNIVTTWKKEGREKKGFRCLHWQNVCWHPMC